MKVKKTEREKIIKEIEEMENTWKFDIQSHSNCDVWEVLKKEIVSKLLKI